MAQRQQLLTLIDEAQCVGVRATQACEVLGVCVRTVQRWRGDTQGDQRVEGVRVPHNKLPALLREEILVVLNSPAYRDRPPSQIVPCLADSGTYRLGVDAVSCVARRTPTDASSCQYPVSAFAT